jgi:hypothetical protein
MRTAGAFTLEIEPATRAMPPRVAVVLASVDPDDQGRVRLTPGCMTLDELESAINPCKTYCTPMLAERLT